MSSEDSGLTFEEVDFPGDGTVRRTQVPVPRELAQRILDYLFTKKDWHTDVYVIHARVRQWKQELRRAVATVAPPASPELAAAHDWEEQAFQLRHPAVGEPMSWRQIVKVVNRPLSTVRRAVAEREAGREVAAA